MAQDVFYSIEDLEEYLTGYANGMTTAEARKLVPLVAETLKANIKHHIDAYYASYTPVYYRNGFFGHLLKPWGYVRTNMLSRSLENVAISMSETSTKNQKDITCEFTFDEDMAKSESALNELSGGWEEFPQYEGNRVDLIQGGWKVKKNVWFKNIEHFGYQEGYDFIGKAINDTLAQIDTKDMIDIYVIGARNVSTNSPHVHVK